MLHNPDVRRSYEMREGLGGGVAPRQSEHLIDEGVVITNVNKRKLQKGNIKSLAFEQ